LYIFVAITGCKHPDEDRRVQEKSVYDSIANSEINVNISEYTDWIKYDIDNFGDIMIPPEMELQSGKYKEMNDKLRSIAGFVDKQIVFQQSGLNDFDGSAKESYARIMLKTSKSDLDIDGDLYDFPLSEYELEEMQSEFEKEFTKSMKSQKIQITEWYPIKIVRVNGMEGMLMSYKRKLGNNPEAFVKTYQFLNGSKQHLVTLSYRITDADKWKPLLDKALSSLSISKIE